MLCASIASPVAPAFAVTPESPEVIELVNLGLKYLGTKTTDELGGKCLIGLCFLKAPEKQVNHPRVAEALAACKAEASKGSVDAFIAAHDDGVYSNGLAVIFLCELDAERHRSLIEFYLGAMKKRQKAHGGWGYNANETGDTSQTQYGALAYWEAHRRGFSIDPNSVERLADWLGKVQDPAGGWAYQGQLSNSSKKITQKHLDITCSRVAACMGSALICADLFGLLQGSGNDDPSDLLPTALRESSSQNQGRPPLKSSTLDRKSLFETIRLGDQWMEKNYKVDIGIYNSYYMYALERYRSFQEKQTGIRPDEPDWYNKGYRYLKDSQKKPGMWETGCVREGTVDTAFSILFLVRSTQKALEMGEGTLLAGRGLPANLSRAKLKNGQVVVEQAKTQITELITLLDDDKQDALDDLIGDESALVITNVDENSARRLQQVIRSGNPEARVLATRALGRTADLDYVPTLIFALTDPDPRVVREADTGLQFVSRKFGGFGLKDRFTDREKYDVIDKWKTWYRGIRPDAVIPGEN